MWFWIILVVVLFLLLGKRKSKNESKSTTTILPEAPKIRMLNRDGDPYEDEWHTYVAGVPYHASKYDVGGFTGFVANDPANKVDDEAMGIYNSFKKLLGYIPADELDDYREWCDAQVMPCVGFVYVEDGKLRGRVKILRPCNEKFLQEEFNKYLQWVHDNYGKEYLPKTLGMTFETE